MPNKFIDYTDAQLENLINNVYQGSISPSVLPVDLYVVILDRLTNAVYKGFGDSLDTLTGESADRLLLEYYVHNIAIFSGAKVHQQVKDMSNLLFTDDGMKREFSEFRSIIKGDNFYQGLFSLYNDNYLRTEYNTAFGTAQMGREWLSIVDDSDVFPFLKYVTAHDERVRHSHAEFDGVVRPVGDAFWNTHVPPNGFNCRCRLVQLNPEDDVFTVTPDDRIKDMPSPDSSLFEFNPGKNAYIFDENIHPYTKNIDERYKVAQSVNFGLPTPPKPKTPYEAPKVKKAKNKK